jgi:hypothetical protein
LAIHHLNQEATSRGTRMLRTALGPAIALWLEDASVVEVMLNPDGWRAVRMKIRQIQKVPDFISARRWTVRAWRWAP